MKFAAVSLFISFGRSNLLIFGYPNTHISPAVPRLSMYMTVGAVFIRDKSVLPRAAIKETVYSSMTIREFSRELNLILWFPKKIFGPETDEVTGE